MELTQKEDNSALILHLVNFDSKNPLVKNIKVDIKVPEGKKVTNVTIMTPDGRSDESLKFKENGERISFTVSQLSVYDIAVIKLN